MELKISMLKTVSGLMIPFLIISPYYYKDHVDKDLDPINKLFSGVKVFGYGLLAWHIFKNSSGNETIDILVFFTFMLSVFECSHNLSAIIGPFIGAFLRKSE